MSDDALREALEPTLGPHATNLLMRKLPSVPPSEFATKTDLRELEARIDARFREVDHRFDEIDQRFDAIDRRFEQIDRRFEAMDARFGLNDAQHAHLEELWNERFDKMEHALTATFRAELNSAMVIQTRYMIFSTLGAVVSLGGLALGLATFG